MTTTLLETAAAAGPAVPTIVMGLIVFAILMSGLVWVIGMGSGRPHSK